MLHINFIRTHNNFCTTEDPALFAIFLNSLVLRPSCKLTCHFALASQRRTNLRTSFSTRLFLKICNIEGGPQPPGTPSVATSISARTRTRSLSRRYPVSGLVLFQPKRSFWLCDFVLACCYLSFAMLAKP